MENFENRKNAQDSYKTGSTNPSQNRGGLVAGLLVAVILLAGVVSILGLMNIKLFQMLQKENSVSFTTQPQLASEPKETDSGTVKLGVTVASISELDQRYFHLPAGALITEVKAGGCGEKAGLAVGDIVISWDGVSIADASALEQALRTCRAGQQVAVEIYRYRAEKQFTITIILEED